MAVNSDNESRGFAGSLGEVVEKISTLIHDEIELAKAEVIGAITSLARGTVIGLAGAVFFVFGLFILLEAIALLISDAFDQQWSGFFIVAAFLFIMGALASWLAAKGFRRGSRIVPSQAIAEADKTKSALSAAALHSPGARQAAIEDANEIADSKVNSDKPKADEESKADEPQKPDMTKAEKKQNKKDKKAASKGSEQSSKDQPWSPGKDS